MEPEHLESLFPPNTREKEISAIFSFVKNGTSCQLIGLPGSGKASILGFLAYNRTIRIHHVGEAEQTNYHFVLCDFSEVRTRPLFDIMKFLFLQFSSSLHERRREKEFLVVDKLFKEALSYNDELVLFQQLKTAIDFLTLEKKLRIIFLFEHFDTFIPSVTSDFFTNLRSLRSRADYLFSVVFSTTRPLEESLEQETLSQYFEFIAEHHVYTQLRDDIDSAFRIAYLEKLTQKKLSEATKKDILDTTGGHIKLTRLSIEAALIESTKVFTISSLFQKKTIQATLKEIWQFLTPDEQQDILTLCKGKLCPLPSVFLQEVGLIKENKITIPLFSQYLQTQKIENQNTTFFLDETTNTIKRGSITISDMLTLSEFRLLKLLLQHQSEVVDREEIITTVWTDSKTQEGVSEQAVDQLLSRLRKKIEEDPTNPVHIQTIKGRGVKFN